MQKPKHGDQPADFLDGVGAAKAGGRWNRRGRPLVYLSATLSLATLETLVQVRRRDVLSAYNVLSVEVPEELCMMVQEGDLPDGWDRPLLNPPTRVIGDSWLSKESSIGLIVPSAVLPSEKNLLLNPMHPDFSDVVSSDVITYALDSRLLV